MSVFPILQLHCASEKLPGSDAGNEVACCLPPRPLMQMTGA